MPYLREAVRLDPSFALAWAELGSRLALARFKFEEGAMDVGPAKQAIDTAVKLAPNDPGVIESVGDYYYYAFRDYARATEQYYRLAQLRPNDPSMFFSLGLIQRREGRMADALPNLRQGVRLDPKNYQYALELASSLGAVRHYAEADSVFRSVLEANPTNYSVQALLYLNQFSENGSTAGFDAFNRLTPDPAQRSVYLYMKGNCAGARGDYATLFQVNREQRYYDDDPDNPRWSQDVAVAEAYAEAGDMKAARQRATEALALIKAQQAHQADNPMLWSSACLAQALLGNREEALRAARRSTEVLPESRDALFGPQNAQVIALGLAWAGEKARALAEVERLLQVPWGLNVYFCRASFLPLRDDPRFKALMADPKNNAPMF